jgi:hypothetical protein
MSPGSAIKHWLAGMSPRRVMLLLLCALCAGCSTTQLAYRNADWLLERYARQTLDISEEQRQHWQPQLESTLQQHREDLLPLVIGYLDRLDAALQETQEDPDIDCLVDGAISLYRQHAELAVELSVPLLLQLDAGQIEHLDEHLAEKNAELHERYRDPDPARRQAERIERITERVERWTGRLSDTQQRQLAEDIGRIPDLTGQWLTNRTAQTDSLLRMLQDNPDETRLQAHLYRWWVQRDDQPPTATRDWDTARQGFNTMLQHLGRSLTDDQRETFRRRIADLRGDLATFQGESQQATFACQPARA